MKISIITHLANPEEKQFPYREALDSYLGFADEVIVVNGGKKLEGISNKIKVIENPDPKVWIWSVHPLNLNLALMEASGDWIMWTAIDFILDEKYFKELRERLEESNFPVASMQKFSVYPHGKYKNKGATPQLINAKFKDRIRFGKDTKNYSDLTYPIWWNGELDKSGVPIGTLIKEDEWMKTGIPFWNFDYTFRTLDVAKKEFLRMSLSHKEYFGETKWGDDLEKSWNVFLKHMKRNLENSGLEIGDGEVLPKYIYYKYKRLTPDQFGYKGWGLI